MIFLIFIFLVFFHFSFAGICIGNDVNNTVVKFYFSINNCYLPSNNQFLFSSNFCNQSITNESFENNLNNVTDCFFPSYGFYSATEVRYFIKIKN